MNVEMLWFECWVCGIPFGMSRSCRDRFKVKGGTFHCINGCALGFGESENDKLKAKLTHAENSIATKERLLAAARKEATRFKCPHCPKSYANQNGVLRHVRDVHQAPLRLAANAGPNALNSKVS
jgi:predicted RNA-binding Zn-ribbon protein involved in translation (DUF1610 family)